MSVYSRIVGRELPCNLLSLLDAPLAELEASEHLGMVDLAELGQLDAQGLQRLGQSHMARGELGLARHRFEEALSQWPGYVEARLALAATFDLLAEHEQAEKQIDAILAALPKGDQEISRRPSRYVLLCAAGLCLERMGRWQEAKSRYALATADRPTDLFALHRLAAIHLTHDELHEACGCLREILTIQPQDQASRVCLAHLLQQTRKNAEAVWEYEQAVCLEPDSWEMPLEAMSKLHTTENSDEALGLLEELVGAQPHFPDLRMRLGNMYSRRGYDEMARAQYGKALSLHPEYLDCHIALARHELRMGRSDEALAHYRQAIAINSQNVEAYVGLAVALHRSGLDKRSAEILASAGRICNNSAVLMVQMATIEAEDPNAETALAAGSELRMQWVIDQIARDETTAALHPSWTDVRVRQAMLLRLAGRYEEACRHLRHLVREEPGCTEAWLQLGLALADHSQPEKAMRSLKKALRLNETRAE
ncbi:MAG TPA: tetratricopeptide repeat protein, partial [Tepidisphaeraceae bacterium]|nr:tetratricopeptide repeat protein [Tepidisphaeraceae bacterium]